MGNHASYGNIVRFELESATWFTDLIGWIPIHWLSRKSAHHVKAWLPTDKEGGWVTYEITSGMQNSECVTVLASMLQTVAKNPQGGDGGPTELQLVRVVGNGRVEDVRLYGS